LPTTVCPITVHDVFSPPTIAVEYGSNDVAIRYGKDKVVTQLQDYNLAESCKQ